MEHRQSEKRGTYLLPTNKIHKKPECSITCKFFKRTFRRGNALTCNVSFTKSQTRLTLFHVRNYKLLWLHRRNTGNVGNNDSIMTVNEHMASESWCRVPNVAISARTKSREHLAPELMQKYRCSEDKKVMKKKFREFPNIVWLAKLRSNIV